MMHVTGMLAIIGFFTVAALTIFLYFRTRHRERMALIQSDKDARIFNPREDGRKGIKIGLLSVSLGVGFFMGTMIEGIFGMDSPSGVFPMVLIFGGLGLLIYNRYMDSLKEDEY